MNEFNLSAKICEAVMLNKDKSSTNLILDVIPDEDVKEFIKRLKEEVDDTDWFNKRDIYCVWKIIDKLAGKQLGEK